MARIAPFGRSRYLDANGDPLSGGKLYTYEAGTTTPKETYTDSTGNTANTNPVILDSEGYCDVWLDVGGYKFVLDDANDVNQWTVDNISGDTETAFGSTVRVVTTNTNVLADFNNNILLCTSSLTLSLLPAGDAGQGYYILVANQSSGDVTIDPDGSEQINPGGGAASTFVLKPGDSALLFTNSDQSGWAAALGFADRDVEFTREAKFSGPVTIEPKGELTIASGAVTVTGAYHTIDTESDAASDDLDTINGGVDGSILLLRPADSARDIVIKHATGNILTPDGRDFTLDRANRTVLLQYRSGDSAWLMFPQPRIPYGYVKGYTLSLDADTDHDVLLQPGGCADDSNLFFINLPSAITKRLDANWAVGDDQGGLDTGAAANTTLYYIYAIMRTDTGVVDVLFSTSSSSPTMPANYDLKRRIGSFRTDGSANIISSSLLSEGQVSRIWAITTGGSSPAITSGNGLTVSRPGSSIYRFTFAVAQPDANYGVTVSTIADGDRISALRTTNKATTHFEVLTVNASFAGADPTGGVSVEVIPSTQKTFN